MNIRLNLIRPTDLSSGIDKDHPDYIVCSGQWDIGRIYQTRGGPENMRWFWSMTVNGPMTRSEFSGARASRMRNSTVERDRRPAAANARILGPRYASVNSFTDHRALELGDHAHL